MELRNLLVLTGDHQVADPTKWGGGYSEADLALHRAMVEALRSLGRFEVEVLSDHSRLFDRLRDGRPDLVVNFCDTGFRNQATQEMHIPALLEMVGIPYTGAPPAAMVLAYDKALVNLIGSSLGVPVPSEAQVTPTADLDTLDVAFPALVKPAQGDGSVGINRHAVVTDRDALFRQLTWLWGELPGRAALVQEYLPGPEYGMALLGNAGCFSALPMLRVDYAGLPEHVPPILAFESKTGPANPYNAIRIVPAGLDRAVVDTLLSHACRMFDRLGCRDYARFDFRTAADGTIKLIEVNPNPAWDPEAKLALMAGFEGTPYPALLERLVDIAWARVTKGGRAG